MAPVQTNPVGVSDAAADEALEARRRRLWEACCRFESVLVNQMLQTMRQTVSDDGGIVKASAGRRMMQESSDQHLADVLAARGGTGVARKLYDGFARQALGSGAALDAPA